MFANDQTDIEELKELIDFRIEYTFKRYEAGSIDESDKESSEEEENDLDPEIADKIDPESP